MEPYRDKSVDAPTTQHMHATAGHAQGEVQPTTLVRWHKRATPRCCRKVDVEPVDWNGW